MITIEEGLILNNPTAKITAITYVQDSNLISVQILFKEEGSVFDHSREYIFENETGEDMVYADVLELVKSHEIIGVLFGGEAQSSSQGIISSTVNAIKNIFTSN